MDPNDFSLIHLLRQSNVKMDGYTLFSVCLPQYFLSPCPLFLHLNLLFPLLNPSTPAYSVFEKQWYWLQTLGIQVKHGEALPAQVKRERRGGRASF